MMKNKKVILYSVIAAIILFIIVGLVYFFNNRKKPVSKKKKKKKVAQEDTTEVDWSEISISKINPEKRAEYGQIYDSLMSVDEIQDDLGFFDFLPDWKIKVLPPKSNIPVRFLVTDSDSKQPVLVSYDPHGIKTGKDEKLWIVRSNILETLVKYDNQTGLFDAIRKYLASAPSVVEEVVEQVKT